ncbi:helix-turn-helix transcriptional regulator [Corynebacterium sp. ES2794-CONJ1]|uniref:helix-turn-helix transcriptional regulator n=1 Tax=unclassified Corynebacterium TaxID=2624378 RepID=UPI0021690A87|nr:MULTISPECIES: AraC family transcriptional regulator [unclassified Corynebacterium]MCS4489945.1 helix-turn-helix transcriptional regulator [Corynebacterium sp. ES2775-CONJ]MCS4491692.1 helix-turn-helix transcriptional regulator [Corynebacterium sp. ES2715-CONJ3]MCS4531797.1 helix-turn-helix transcriptional regulator [Corynebacterium sp. ES2730-CONJ]MCU9519193.1 helix-turn-helix transcriptional regulator [Corynebacterium sp. ES2794-CONJ1]
MSAIVIKDTTKTRTTTFMWCRIGQAIIKAPDRMLHIVAGDLVIAPESATVIDSAEASIISFKFTDMLPGPTRKISLGPDWDRRIIAEYARARLGEKHCSEGFLTTLHQPRFQCPPLPVEQAARRVASELLAQPSCTTSLEVFAQSHRISARTLQRQFLKSTGLPFSEWRAACRVASAADLISRGMSIKLASQHVGFSATSSLTRAFKRHTGQTPASFLNLKSVHVPLSDPLTVFARARTDLVLWLAHGSATVTTPGYCRFLAQGETVTILSGTHTRLDIASGSIALPVSPRFNEHAVDALSRALDTQGDTFLEGLTDSSDQEALTPA